MGVIDEHLREDMAPGDSGAAEDARAVAAKANALGDLVTSGRLSEPELNATIGQAIDAATSPAIAVLPLAGQVDAYGESTTAGAGFETHLAAYTGLAVTNRGVSGQGVSDELLRSGAIRPRVTLMGDSLPGTTDPVPVTTIDPDRGWRQPPGSGSFGFEVLLKGVRCSLQHNLTSGAWTIQRLTAGAPVAVPPGTELVRPDDAITPTRRLIFWGGRNNATDGTMPAIAEMIAQAPAGQRTRVREYLILGVINGKNEPRGHARYAKIIATNARSAQIHGDLFFDVRRGFIDRGLAIRGIIPTTTDLANIANDCPPPSLMADDIHPNADGYLVINYLVAEKLLAIGWVDSISLPPIPVNWVAATSDSFNRADTSAGTLGTTDAAAGGAALAWTADSQLQVLSNQVGAASLSTNRKATVNVGAADMAVQAKMAVTRDGCGLFARYADANNYYAIIVASTGGWGIYKRVAGTQTAIATGTGTVVDGDVLRLEVRGSELRGYRNGVLATPITTDASLTAGNLAGIRSAFNDAAWRLDDFLVEVAA